jgi:hypothetical protein
VQNRCDKLRTALFSLRYERRSWAMRMHWLRHRVTKTGAKSARPHKNDAISSSETESRAATLSTRDDVGTSNDPTRQRESQFSIRGRPARACWSS